MPPARRTAACPSPARLTAVWLQTPRPRSAVEATVHKPARTVETALPTAMATAAGPTMSARPGQSPQSAVEATVHQPAKTARREAAITGATATASGQIMSARPGRSAAPARPAQWARATATRTPSAPATSSAVRTIAGQTLIKMLVRQLTAA